MQQCVTSNVTAASGEVLQREWLKLQNDPSAEVMLDPSNVLVPVAGWKGAAGGKGRGSSPTRVRLQAPITEPHSISPQ